MFAEAEVLMIWLKLIFETIACGWVLTSFAGGRESLAASNRPASGKLALADAGRLQGHRAHRLWRLSSTHVERAI